MTSIEIQRRLAFWLRAQSLEVEILNPSELYVTVGDATKTWQCRIICEDAPLTVHYLSRVPGRVPEHAIPDLAERLLDLNRSIRFGQFSLDSKRGTVTFRLTQRLSSELPLDVAFCEALSISHREMATLGKIGMHFLAADTLSSVY